MSADSLEHRRRATEASFARSLDKLRDPYYQGPDAEEYLGPIAQSGAYRSAIGSHMTYASRELMTDPTSTHYSRVARPLDKRPGALIELSSSLGGKMVQTRYTYYGQEEDESIADTWGEMRLPATTLGNKLDFEEGTRELLAFKPDDTQRAARHILTELHQQGCIDPKTEHPTIEGTVRRGGEKHMKTVIIDFSQQGGRSSCWKYDGTGLRRLDVQEVQDDSQVNR